MGVVAAVLLLLLPLLLAGWELPIHLVEEMVAAVHVLTGSPVSITTGDRWVNFVRRTLGAGWSIKGTAVHIWACTGSWQNLKREALYRLPF